MASPKAIRSATSSPVAAGAFTDANNNPIANGYILFTLSVPVAELTGGGEISSIPPVKVTLDVNGVPSANQTIFGTDQIASPLGVTYQMVIYSAAGNTINSVGKVAITGAAPVDITQLTITNQNVSYPGVVLLSPSGNQSITGGFSLSNTGPIQAGDGTAAAPGFGFTSATNTGLFRNSNTIPQIVWAGTAGPYFLNSAIALGSGGVYALANTVDPNAGTRDTGISRTAAGTVAIGTGAQGSAAGQLRLDGGNTQSNPVLSVRNQLGSINNQVEFGHSNQAGYGSNIGVENSSGNPFIAFMSEAGTNANTYRTRGNTASIIRAGVSGPLTVGTVASNNADNQSFVTLFSFNTSGTLTAPNATDTLVARATTDTLTSKTLGGSGSTNKDTLFNRFRATQGTTLVSGDFALSAGWGATASLAVSGTDAACSFTVTANGAGLGVNPTVTLTFHDGTWTNAPVVVTQIGPQTGGISAFQPSTISATSVIFTWLGGTPVAGLTYNAQVICMGK